MGTQRHSTSDPAAQTSLIENLTALDEKKTARITDLEQVLASTQTALDKATERADAAVAPAQLDTRLDGKSEKELRQEVHKLRKTLQTREEQSKWAIGQYCWDPSAHNLQWNSCSANTTPRLCTRVDCKNNRRGDRALHRARRIRRSRTTLTTNHSNSTRT